VGATVAEPDPRPKPRITAQIDRFPRFLLLFPTRKSCPAPRVGPLGSRRQRDCHEVFIRRQLPNTENAAAATGSLEQCCE